MRASCAASPTWIFPFCGGDQTLAVYWIVLFVAGRWDTECTIASMNFQKMMHDVRSVCAVDVLVFGRHGKGRKTATEHRNPYQV